MTWTWTASGDRPREGRRATKQFARSRPPEQAYRENQQEERCRRPDRFGFWIHRFLNMKTSVSRISGYLEVSSITEPEPRTFNVALSITVTVDK